MAIRVDVIDSGLPGSLAIAKVSGIGTSGEPRVMVDRWETNETAVVAVKLRVEAGPIRASMAWGPDVPPLGPCAQASMRDPRTDRLPAWQPPDGRGFHVYDKARTVASNSTPVLNQRSLTMFSVFELANEVSLSVTLPARCAFPEPGYFPAMRAGDYDVRTGGINLRVRAETCNRQGAIVIDEATHDGDGIVSLKLRFEVECRTQTLRGSVDWSRA